MSPTQKTIDAARHEFIATLVRFVGDDLNASEAYARMRKEGQPDLDTATNELLALLGDVASAEEATALRLAVTHMQDEFERSQHPGSGWSYFGVTKVGYKPVLQPLDAACLNWPHHDALAEAEKALSSVQAELDDAEIELENAIDDLDVQRASELQARVDYELPASVATAAVTVAQLHADRAEAYRSVAASRIDDQADQMARLQAKADAAMREHTAAMDQLRKLTDISNHLRYHFTPIEAAAKAAASRTETAHAAAVRIERDRVRRLAESAGVR